jgi:hypothetical protein
VLTAARIITDAKQIAKVRGFDAQALDAINEILSDLCEDHDLALARGQFNFNFDPNLSGSLFGSGPYPLPLDYLRTSGSSGARGVTKSAFYLYPAPALPAGQPIFMTPIDLAEFDLFAKLPSQSTPELWCTDMGGPLTQRIILATAAALTSGSTTGTLADTTGLYDGLAMAGEGITPGTVMTTAPFTQTTTGDTHTSTTVDNIPTPAWDLIRLGDTVTATDISTTVAALPMSGTVTLTATASGSNTGEAITFARPLLLSLPATMTLAAASVYFGIAPVAYVYPAPLGTYPVTVRYQRMMPPLIDLNSYAWFPKDGYMVNKTAAKLCRYSDDSRTDRFEAIAARELGQYLGLSDDKTNRSQAVQLDGRNYGTSALGGRNLRNTKFAGW